MPATMPPRSPDRCVYKEGRTRCVRDGSGSPKLCALHRIVLDGAATSGSRWGDGIRGIIDRIQTGRSVRETDVARAMRDGVKVLFGDEAAQGVFRDQGRKTTIDMGEAIRIMQSRMRQRVQIPPAQPPPPPPKPKPKGPDPRIALGFAPGELVTVPVVQRRRRELARRHHPDHGGSVAKMASINAAADQLLAELG